MGKYIQLTFANTTADQNEILIALLAEAKFEGFEEEKQNLKAYIPEMQFERDQAYRIGKETGLPFSINTIDETNWNALWESNFEPVTVNGFVHVRADFHPANPGVKHDIVITPKMSFGTGHHATTFMMMAAMEDIVFEGKQVFDFGTGTGILAILAAKLGAKEVLAIDNDQWSINNALENCTNNKASVVKVLKGEKAEEGKMFDVILANINKHVLMATIPELASRLNKGGTLLLSGLLVEDEADITQVAKKAGLKLAPKHSKDNWLCLKLS